MKSGGSFDQLPGAAIFLPYIQARREPSTDDERVSESPGGPAKRLGSLALWGTGVLRRGSQLMHATIWGVPNSFRAFFFFCRLRSSIPLPPKNNHFELKRESGTRRAIP